MKITQHNQINELWLASKTGLRSYVLKKMRDNHLADEITQQVLIKMYNACCSDREIKNVRSWLFQIAQNATIDHLKEQQKLSYEVIDTPDMKEASVWSELSEFIEPLIGFLPEKYAIPLKLADIEGLKQAEISKKLNIGLSATKSRIQRAREMLKDKIQICCHIETGKNGILSDFTVKESCTPLQQIIKSKPSND